MIDYDPDDLPPDPADAAWLAELRALIAESDAQPTLRPSHDLWPGIAARLDPSHEARRVTAELPAVRVLAFPVARAQRAMPTYRRLAAAAVALVCLSSGATYLAMRPSSAVAPTTAAVTPATAPDLPPAVPTRSPESVASAPLASAPLAESTAEPATAPAPARTRPLAARTAIPARANTVDAADAVPGVADYDREIAELRAAVADRRGDLDSATVAVLVRNLRIIDAAIAASRTALARDPHSPFLGDQLTRALGQKVDLLRTAALLPRT